MENQGVTCTGRNYVSRAIGYIVVSPEEESYGNIRCAHKHANTGTHTWSIRFLDKFQIGSEVRNKQFYISFSLFFVAV